MGELRLDCPNPGCATNKAAFTMIASNRSHGDRGCLYACCAVCGRGVVVLCVSRVPGYFQDPHLRSNEAFFANYRIEGVLPELPQTQTIASLPDNVSAALGEAEKAFNSNLPMAAGMAYRTAIERAVKHINPSLSGSLYAQIEALADHLPAGLLKLLHEVRFLGNGAAHEDAPDPEDLAAGREFARLFLTYQFELPAKVQVALKKRAAAKAKAKAAQ